MMNITDEMVRIDETLVDGSYQRKLNMKRAKAIGASFDIALFGTQKISKRANGDKYLIDGQTRKAGAEMSGNGHLYTMAKVYHNLSKAEEAWLFNVFANSTTGITARESFKSLITSKDARALDITKVLRIYDCQVDIDLADLDEVYLDSVAGCVKIQAVQAVEYAHALGVLPKVLRSLRGLHEKDNAYAGTLVRGLAAFFEVYPEANASQMCKGLDKQSPSDLVNSLATLKDGNMSPTEIANLLFFKLYNKGLQGDRRLKRKFVS